MIIAEEMAKRQALARFAAAEELAAEMVGTPEEQVERLLLAALIVLDPALRAKGFINPLQQSVDVIADALPKLALMFMKCSEEFKRARQ